MEPNSSRPDHSAPEQNGSDDQPADSGTPPSEDETLTGAYLTDDAIPLGGQDEAKASQANTIDEDLPLPEAPSDDKPADELSSESLDTEDELEPESEASAPELSSESFDTASVDRNEPDDMTSMQNASTTDGANAWSDVDESARTDTGRDESMDGSGSSDEPTLISSFYPSGATDQEASVRAEDETSDTSASAWANETADVDDEVITAGEEPARSSEEPLVAAGTTTCPTCGRETDALRFCGYCGATLVDQPRPTENDGSRLGDLRAQLFRVLEPIADWTKPGAVRAILAVGAALIVLSLLANSGALALVIGACLLPLAILYWCTRNDVFEREPLYILAGFAIAGIAVGALLGWFSSLLVENSWFDDGVLNYGAAGFGGKFAEAAGNPPFAVWSLVGIVLPFAAIAALIGLPLAGRQALSLRNEVMDGVTVAAALGGGIAVGSAMVFVSPMYSGGGPQINAQGWTLLTIGLTIVRPLIWTFAGGLLGAAAWRYLLSGTMQASIIPAVLGVAGPLLYTLMSLQLQASGMWGEFLWGIVVAAVLGFFYQKTVSSAVSQDRRILGTSNARVVCPHCGKVTPAGQYCANCGEPLPQAEAARA